MHLMCNCQVAHNGWVTGVEREIFLPESPEEVWDVVTDPESLGEWFGADVDGELVPGEVTRFSWPDGTERRALVESVVPPKRLAFRWLPSDDGDASRVQIDIDEAADGTRVRVVETQIEAAVSPTPRIGFKTLARL